MSVPAVIFLAVILVQRLGELFLARHNTSRLLAQGGREVGAEHYPLIVAVHIAWIFALVVLGWKSALIWPWIGAYVLLQMFRVWILSSLGSRWTTRIIVIDEPLVQRGPYRFIRHPNYLLVAAELVVGPMALSLPIVALVFTILNAAVLTIRIRAENDAWQIAGQRSLTAAARQKTTEQENHQQSQWSTIPAPSLVASAKTGIR